jgi:Tol biopolymer transport system component
MTPLLDASIYERAKDREPFSPDGTRIAVAVLGDVDYDLALRDVRHGWTEYLASQPGASLAPAWSPTAPMLAYVMQAGMHGDLHLVDLEAESDRPLLPALNLSQEAPSWSPDGTQLVFAARDHAGSRGLWLVEVASGRSQSMTHGIYNDWDPVWIKPLISYTPPVSSQRSAALDVHLDITCHPGEEDADITILAWDATGGQRPISRVRLALEEAQLFDSGSVAVSRYARTFNVAFIHQHRGTMPTLQLKVWNEGHYRETPQVVTAPITCGPVAALPSAVLNAITPTPLPTSTPAAPTPTPQPYDTYLDKIIFKSDRSGEESFYIMNPDGSHQRKLPPGQGELHYQRAQRIQAQAPDGKREVFVQEFKERGIFILDVNAGILWKLSEREGVYYEPAWSPLGDRIVYAAHMGNTDHLFLMDVQTRVERQLTENLYGTSRHPSWSSDGQKIIFWSTRETGYGQIWLMDLESDSTRNLSNNEYNDWDPVWVQAPQ